MSEAALHLTRIEIRNLFNHDHTEIELDQGLNVIAGPNGSGKSSLMEAIYFALYGSKAAGVMGLTLDEILRDEADDGHVTVEFRHRGIDYRATMGLRRRNGKTGSHNCSLVSDEGEWSGASAMTDAMAEIVGMSAEDVANAVYIRQGDVDRIIHARPEERRSLMDRLLQLAELDTYGERAKKARSAVNRRHKETQGQLSEIDDDIQELEDDEVERRCEETRLAVEDKQSVRYRTFQGLQTAKDELSQLQALQKRQSEIDQTRRTIEEKRGELGPLNQEINDLRGQLPDIQADNPKGRMSEIETRRNEGIPHEIQSARDEAKRQIEELAISEAQTTATRLEADLGNLDKQIRHRQNLIDQGKCPECGQSVDEVTFDISEDRSRRDDLQCQLNQAQEEVNNLKTRQAEIEQERDEAIQKLTNEESRLRVEHDRLSTYVNLSSEINDKQRQYRKTQEHIGELERQLPSEDELDPQELERINDQVQRLTNVFNRIDSETKQLENDHNKLALRVNDLKSKRENRNQAQARKDQLEAWLAEVDQCGQFYGQIKQELREQKVAAIEREANRLFRLMDDGHAYTGLEISTDYDIAVELRDGRRVTPSHLSGGERGLVNMALRGAIHQVLSRAQAELPLLLDEPTTHLDDTHVQRLRHLLEDLSGQVLLVTHEEGLMDVADREFRAEKLADNTSRVNRVR
ncbi:MAG: AAA family ATPase [Salinibacter sp.]